MPSRLLVSLAEYSLSEMATARSEAEASARIHVQRGERLVHTLPIEIVGIGQIAPLAQRNPLVNAGQPGGVPTRNGFQ